MRLPVNRFKTFLQAQIPLNAETHTARTLKLFFPQWQGAAQRKLYDGARLLHSRLKAPETFAEVAVSSNYSLAVHNDVLGHHQILSQLLQARQVIEHHAPDRIVTLGGDCGVEIAPVSFMQARYGDELAVLWLDAHADLNTPQTSPSQRFHGMPLRALLGDGDPDITSKAFGKLQPEQVFLLGTREFDIPEQTFMHRHSLPHRGVEEMTASGQKALLATLKAAGFTRLYIHLDLDVLNPQEFPHVTCPTAGGLSIASLINLLQRCDREFDIVGFSLLEFFPKRSPHQAVEAVVNLIAQTCLPFNIF